MTKEKLEEEAEEYVKQNYCEMCVMADDCKCGCIDCFTVQAYIASAEPRQKRIAELEEKLANADYQLEGRDLEIKELEAQIEKMKKYGKLLQDICDVMGNDPYMVWRGLEQRILILWDKSEEKKGLEMAENILDRLLKIKPQDWAEIEKWEINEK